MNIISVLKLITYRRTDNDAYPYAVRFNSFYSNLKHFNQFAQKLGDLEVKRYDVASNSWLINKEGLDIFQELNDELYPTIAPKPNIIRVEPRSCTDYQDIGYGMKLQPYDYQKKIVKLSLESVDSLVVAPCGSGKTAAIISLFLEARRNGTISANAKGMVLTKASIKVQWPKEVEKFSSLRPAIIKTYSEAKTAENFKQQFKEPVDLYIANYETLRDEKVRDELKKLGLEFIGADEIQYVKNSSADRSKALYEFNDVKMKIGATATPVQRDPRDLYGIFHFIHPDLFPKKSVFDRTYIKWGGRGRAIGALNIAELNKKITPYTVVLTKEEVSSQLPKLVVMQKYMDLSPKAHEISNQLMAELDELHEQEKALQLKLTDEEAKNNPELQKIEAGIMMRQAFAQEVADSMDLLKASDSDAAKKYVVNCKDAKLDYCIDLIEEIIDSGEKVCVFSKFARMQKILADKLQKRPIFQGFKIAYVYGALSPEQRYEEIYTKFRDNDDYKVLLMSDAGAEGTNLQKCKYMIEMDLADSYAVQTQRHGRLERADSVHDTVFVYQLIANDSWDTIQQKIVAKKEQYDSSIIKGKI